MSWYMDVALTVDAKHGEGLVSLILGCEPEDGLPDEVVRDGEGRVTAFWQARNHFDVTRTCKALEGFLDTLDESEYSMEIHGEDYGREVQGYGHASYCFYLDCEVDGRNVFDMEARL